MASRGKKILIGTGIGCGVLILIVIALVVAFFSWISQPG